LNVLCRLELISEKRQSMVQRVKAAQKERDGLAGDKEAAEAYLAKERECLGQRSQLAQAHAHQAQVERVGKVVRPKLW
jgi:structural maintenance of chromosome 4